MLIKVNIKSSLFPTLVEAVAGPDSCGCCFPINTAYRFMVEGASRSLLVDVKSNEYSSSYER